MNHYPITIHHIFISPGHNYFGRPKEGPGSHPTNDVAQVAVKADKGLVGDRYFGVAAHFNAQITLISAEVFAALLAELGVAGLSPVLTRRNIVVSGVPLNQLIGQEFTIIAAERSAAGSSNDSGNVETVQLAGVKQCSPCAWMDAAIAPGAQKFLRGRGGLRARALSDGLLTRGAATLSTQAQLDLTGLLEPIAKPRLP